MITFPCESIFRLWLAAYPNATAAQKAAFCNIVNQCGGGSGAGSVVTFGTMVPNAAPGPGEPILYQNTVTSTLYIWNGTTWAATTTALPPLVPGLGVSIGAVDPTTPPAPTAPVLYQNIVTEQLFVWTGTAWQRAANATSGGAVVAITSAPPVLAPTPGAALFVYDNTTNVLYVWTGTAWEAVTPPTTALTPGLGVSTGLVDPTAPPAPTAPVFYQNTVTGSLFIWTGTAWQTAAPPPTILPAPSTTFGTIDPVSAPAVGDPTLYQNTTTGRFFGWNGTSWVEVTADQTPPAPGLGVTLGAVNPTIAPAPTDPLFYQNTTTGTLFVWTGTIWQTTAAGAPALTPGLGVTLGAVNPTVAPAPTDPVFYQNTATGVLFVWTGAAWQPAAPTSPVVNVCDSVIAAPNGTLQKVYGVTVGNTCALETVVVGDSLATQLVAIPFGTVENVIGIDAGGAPARQSVSTAANAANLDPVPLTASALGQAISAGVGATCASNVLQTALLQLVNARRSDDAISFASFPPVFAYVPGTTVGAGASLVVASSSNVSITNALGSCRSFAVDIGISGRVSGRFNVGSDPNLGLGYSAEFRLMINNALVATSTARTSSITEGGRGDAESFHLRHVTSVPPGQNILIRIDLVFVNPNLPPQVIDPTSVALSIEPGSSTVLTRWS